MDFKQTCLPDRQIFREAFAAGWAMYVARFAGTALGADQYLRGPVAMARLIFEHGGEERQIAAAACLAGPALFSEHPADWLNERLVKFSREVRGVSLAPAAELGGKISGLSDDARLLLQASAISLLEALAAEKTETASQLMKNYAEALELYSAARGGNDKYKLDTRFEIAAMKVTTVMEGQPHIWAKPLHVAPRVKV